MKTGNTTQETLDLLLSFNTTQLREELEQLLLTLQERGANLERLKEFYENGGLYPNK